MRSGLILYIQQRPCGGTEENPLDERVFLLDNQSVTWYQNPSAIKKKKSYRTSEQNRASVFNRSCLHQMHVFRGIWFFLRLLERGTTEKWTAIKLLQCCEPDGPRSQILFKRQTNNNNTNHCQVKRRIEFLKTVLE